MFQSKQAGFSLELISLTPTLIRSTCDRCGAFVAGRFADGSIKKWEKDHDCAKTVARPMLLRRLRSWLSH